MAHCTSYQKEETNSNKLVDGTLWGTVDGALVERPLFMMTASQSRNRAKETDKMLTPYEMEKQIKIYQAMILQGAEKERLGWQAGRSGSFFMKLFARQSRRQAEPQKRHDSTLCSA
jgi:hypothetical protein